MAIALTERAARHVRRFLASRELQTLRIGVRKTGCSGLSYVVEPATAVSDADSRFESHGVVIVVDRDALPFLDGIEVDYGREGLNEGFRFNNPNVKATCGCGSSFTVES
jgi:iron-sulfur cluster assembly protein